MIHPFKTGVTLPSELSKLPGVVKIWDCLNLSHVSGSNGSFSKMKCHYYGTVFSYVHSTQMLKHVLKKIGQIQIRKFNIPEEYVACCRKLHFELECTIMLKNVLQRMRQCCLKIPRSWHLVICRHLGDKYMPVIWHLNNR